MDERRPHGSPAREIARQCTAMSKQSGERCKKSAMRGRNVCRAHGGATPRGIGSRSFRHGRYSKNLPANLASRYEEALEDPELLSLRDEVALIHTRIGALLAQVGDDQARSLDVALWQEVAKLVELQRRLAETQVKHQVTAQSMISIEQALTLAAAVANTVRRHVDDPSVLSEISREIERVIEQR